MLQDLLRAGAAGLLLLGIPGGGQPTAAGQQKQTFTGVVTDEMCPTGDHSKMRMGANDAECATACVDSHGAAIVLFDGKSAYGLSDQKTAATMVARRVRVVGTLDSKSRRIAVESMAVAP
jgi:hypothetical protein